MDGFETANWLKETHPQILIMALSMQDDEQSLIKMIKSGAKGYLLKNVHPAELEKALNSLVKNGSYYPNWVTSKVLTALVPNLKQTLMLQILQNGKKNFYNTPLPKWGTKKLQKNVLQPTYGRKLPG